MSKWPPQGVDTINAGMEKTAGEEPLVPKPMNKEGREEEDSGEVFMRRAVPRPPVQVRLLAISCTCSGEYTSFHKT